MLSLPPRVPGRSVQRGKRFHHHIEPKGRLAFPLCASFISSTHTHKHVCDGHTHSHTHTERGSKRDPKHQNSINPLRRSLKGFLKADFQAARRLSRSALFVVAALLKHSSSTPSPFHSASSQHIFLFQTQFLPRLLSLLLL